MESELDKLYYELGRDYYEGAYEDPLPELLPYFDKITKIKKQMKADQSHADPCQFCPNCGYKIAPGDVFCENCGAKIE